MNIRTKLLLSFFSLSALIIIVGLIFYTQLRNLIQPLAPQSIPLSVDQLSNSIEKNAFYQNILYQNLLVKYNLKNYIYTNDLSKLQKYYMNEEILSQLLLRSKKINPALWKILQTKFLEMEKKQFQIIDQMKTGHSAEAKSMLESENYTKLNNEINEALDSHFQKLSINQNENAIVTIKLSTSKTTQILKESLNTTVLIFVNAIIISLLLALISTRAISRPVNLLRNNIERMGTKNLNSTINARLLVLKGEIGDLARSFNSLINKLRTTTVLRDELLLEVQRRKEIESELRQTASDLQESNRELDEFAYAASHDLRAPLRAISNLAEWIEEDCGETLPEESKNHLRLLKKRVNRLDDLINGILEYSRAGRLVSQSEETNLNQVIEEVIEHLSPPSHISIHVENELPTLITNKVLITQIFLNLISNAIKYNDKPQGQINIGYQDSPDFYQFHVTDNGPGIDSQFYEKIFIIFQTLQSRDAIESSGIGLAIVKKVIEKQGGKIWVNSLLGHGTTFNFTWPKK